MALPNEPTIEHSDEPSPGPDGRVPSSTGPGITIKSPGPETYDPRAYEAATPTEDVQAGTRRDEDIFPEVQRGGASDLDESNS